MTIEYLELTRQRRHCRRCRADTYWAIRRQLDSSSGICLDHADGHPCAEPTLTLAELFGVLPIEAVNAPARTAVAGRTETVWRWVVAGIRWRSTAAVDTKRGMDHG